MSKTKFKVGDKVRVVNTVCGASSANIGDVGEIKTFVGGDRLPYAVEFEVNRCEYHDCNGYTKRHHGYWCSEVMLELVEDKNQPIVIYRKDNKVIALNKNTGEKGVAKCSPDDKFDFVTGAKLAFERLITEDEKTHPHPHLIGDGTEYYGKCGEPTKYKDAVGRPLFVGDIVEIFNANGEYRGKQFVVKAGRGYTVGKAFIMGIESICDDKTGEIDEWKVIKFKSFDVVKDGDNYHCITKVSE